MQFNTEKFVHKALYTEGCPDYLKLELISNRKTLQSNMETRMDIKIHSHIEDQQYLMCYLKISKNWF